MDNPRPCATTTDTEGERKHRSMAHRRVRSSGGSTNTERARTFSSSGGMRGHTECPIQNTDPVVVADVAKDWRTTWFNNSSGGAGSPIDI